MKGIGQQLQRDNKIANAEVPNDTVRSADSERVREAGRADVGVRAKKVHVIVVANDSQLGDGCVNGMLPKAKEGVG